MKMHNLIHTTEDRSGHTERPVPGGMVVQMVGWHLWPRRKGGGDETSGWIWIRFYRARVEDLLMD